MTPFRGILPAGRLALLHGVFVAISPAPEAPPPEPPTVDVTLADGSKLKAKLLDKELVVRTKHGPQTVRMADIQEVSFATRPRPEDAERVSAAVKLLGHPDFQTRERASLSLRDCPDATLPLLHAAAKGTDPEVATRADHALKGRRFTPRPADTVKTLDGCTLVGTVECERVRMRRSHRRRSEGAR